MEIKEQMMKYCNKCGLPINYPGIVLNEEKICNFCDFYEKNKKKIEDVEYRETLFKKEIEKAQKKAKDLGAPYDCIVGLSGGKDSTYIIWKMKYTYGLRVLAVTFQNGFHTEYGRDNIENALQKLNVDHITVRLNDEQLRKEYTLCVSMLKNFCAVCFHYMHYYCHQIAGKYKIPLIVNGRTKGQILQKTLEHKGIEPFEISRNLKEFEYQMFGKLVEKNAARKNRDYLEDIEVTSLSYFAYHDVSEEETMETLERELGWKRPESKIPHADCWAHPMAEYLSIKKNGYPVRTGELAVLVRSGELSKEETKKMLNSDMNQYKIVDGQLEKKFYERIRPLTKNVGNKDDI